MRQIKIRQSITNREDSFKKYLADISKEKMITPDDEIELANRIKQGDKTALDKLVTSNLRFVISVAKQYQGQGLPLSDLISEGNIGLIKAAEKFDDTRGFKFISYAVWWIRQSIVQAIMNQSRTVKLPYNKIASLHKINKVLNEFEQENLRMPSETEISEKMELSVDIIRDLLKSTNKCVSINTPISEDSELLDVIADDCFPKTDNKLMLESLSKELEYALTMIPVRQREIVRMLFGINCQELTAVEIADRFGITRERVRQIKESAIKKLQKCKFLQAYL